MTRSAAGPAPAPAARRTGAVRLVTGGLVVGGLALFAWVVAQVNLATVWQYVRELGWLGLAAVLGLSCAWYVIDVLIWRLTFRPPFRMPLCFYRLWRVHVVGEALNNITPVGLLGGEPVKAVLVHQLNGVPYRQGVATLVLVQMVNTVALVIFLLVGVALIVGDPAMPEGVRGAALTGFGVLVVCVAVFFMMQRFRWLSRGGRWLERVRPCDEVKAMTRQIHRIEGHIVHIYRERPASFLLGVCLSLVNWLIGALELWLVFRFLGHPIAFADAWAIEAAVVLVRTALFFLPSAVGAQEGVFYVLCGAITGVPPLGLAVALIRRVRELMWVAIGLTLGGRFSLDPTNWTKRAAPPRPASNT